MDEEIVEHLGSLGLDVTPRSWPFHDGNSVFHCNAVDQMGLGVDEGDTPVEGGIRFLGWDRKSRFHQRLEVLESHTGMYLRQ